jgi:GT2 family glycosyltransferase
MIRREIATTTAGSRVLSIVIVNWKSCEFLRKCLESICLSPRDLSIEVIVVDNASFDGSEDLIQGSFPGVRFLQSDRNLGFSGANNLGYKSTQGKYLLFLNPDTEIVGAALEMMVSALDSNPEAGIIGAKLLNSDHSLQTSCVQRFPTILNQALDLDFLMRAFPKLSLWGTAPLFEPHSAPVPVDVVSGACLMIRRDVFAKIGGFSTCYFMYAEDVDLCWKARKAGWKSYYLAGAEVVHHGGRSTAFKEETNFSSVMMRESRLRFMRESRGSAYAVIYRVSTALVAACRVLILSAAFVIPLGKSRGYSSRYAFRKWAAIFRWAIGLESWVRKLA